MNTAGAVYQHSLWREPRALDYVRERGIPDWVIRACCLGYADGHSLEAYLRRRAGLEVAQDLGLLRSRARRPGGALRETLAGRIVVPELRGGQCIWFIGRSLDDDPTCPKYLALARRAARARLRAGGRAARGISVRRGLRLPHRRLLAAARLQPLRHPPARRAARLPRAGRGGLRASSTGTRPGGRRRSASASCWAIAGGPSRCPRAAT